MKIVLIGFMGSGKSAVGRALAAQLNARLLDTDAEIERAAGKPIAAIFAHDGEPEFRRLETAVLTNLAASDEALIVATGGGVPLQPANLPLLRRIGAVVWINVPAEVVLRRVLHELPSRPLLAPYADNPLARIQSLLAEREPHYRAASDVEIDSSHCASPADAALLVRSALEARAAGEAMHSQ